MADWTKDTLKLDDQHTWKARPGYKIFVAGRGAVRLDVPQEWVAAPDPDSFKFYDRPSPEDTCALAVSYLTLPAVDWSGLPISRLVEAAVCGDEREILHKGEIVQQQRPDLELAWREFRFVDPNERREACSRVCIARGSNIQCLITLDFWPEDSARLDPVWHEVLCSLELGQVIRDATKGPAIH